MTPHIIIPTRGDVDARACVSHLGDPYPIIWDNSRSLNLGVFSRYMAALERVHNDTDLIYTQDDDCRITKESFQTLVDIQSINIREGCTNRIVTNMPTAHQLNYAHTPEKLVGFGSIFPRALILPTFHRYLAYCPFDALLLRECDRVFTGLNWWLVDVVDVGVEHLPHATGEGRMYRETGHNAARAEIQARVLKILEIEGKPYKPKSRTAPRLML